MLDLGCIKFNYKPEVLVKKKKKKMRIKPYSSHLQFRCIIHYSLIQGHDINKFRGLDTLGIFFFCHFLKDGWGRGGGAKTILIRVTSHERVSVPYKYDIFKS